MEIVSIYKLIKKMSWNGSKNFKILWKNKMIKIIFSTVLFSTIFFSVNAQLKKETQKVNTH